MNLKLLLAVGLLSTGTYCFSQADTLVFNTNENFKRCTADTCKHLTKAWKDGDVWKRNDFDRKTGTLRLSGSFSDSLFYRPVGLFSYFSEDGKLVQEKKYVQGLAVMELENYYQNGVLIVTNPNAKLKPWNEMEYVSVLKEATFKGGDAGWIEYLQKKLKVNTPVKNGAPAGRYRVEISFIVDSDGNISEVRAENDPGYGTAQEAVRVIAKGPSWQPATVNGNPVVYRQRQSITFVVE